MSDALIGHTGYVGSTLLKQWEFAGLFRSADIDRIAGREFGTVICAGAPAQKWIANREPEADRRNIEHLMGCLATVDCDTFVLISTVDVFKFPVGVTEESRVEETDLHPYGTHRRLLEKFIEQRFPKHLIVRLSGLVGPGLRKNVVFDLLNNNNLHAIDSRSVFQFYPMVNLAADIRAALGERLGLIHLTAEPISVEEVAREGFGRRFEQITDSTPARYDMRSLYGDRLGGGARYTYCKRESVLAIRAYAQSEPAVVQEAVGAS